MIRFSIKGKVFSRLSAFIALGALLACVFSAAQPAPNSGGAVDVLTQHNDSTRTGANLSETILKPSNVNAKQFGKILDVPVDGQIYAQPLVVAGLRIGGRVRNVVYVATAHNSVYALDGDTGQQLWMKNYGPTMPTPNAYLPAVSSNIPYKDINPEHGTSSTPVIDKESGTMYFTTYVQKPHNHLQSESVAPTISWYHYLHAVSLMDGSPRFGSPSEINACVNSSLALDINAGKAHRGRHQVNSQLCFDPLQHMQRPAVLLVKPAGALGQVILAFGSHGDYDPYHGWVMSYQADRVTKQLGVWVSNTDNTPDGSGGGIWQAGMGLPLDDDNNFYLMTGNGTFNADTAFGESFLRFSTANNTISLGAKDPRKFFTPCNRNALDSVDDDLGSSGPMLLTDRTLSPRPQFLIGGGKQGVIYVLDKDNLGGAQTACPDPGVIQEFQAVPVRAHHAQHIHGSPVYWKSQTRGPVIYVWGENDFLRAFPLVLGNTPGGQQWRFNATPPAWAVGPDTSPLKPWTPNNSMMTGGMLSISANGDRDGIVWATTPYNNDANPKAVPGIIHAYDATDLKKELWNSHQRREQDDFGNYAKFTPITVANGKAYVPTFSGHLSVYGLRPDVSAPVSLNFVKDSSFEDGGAAWKSNQTTFINASYTYFGKASGVLCTNVQSTYTPQYCPPDGPAVPKEAELSQTIAAPKDGNYTVKALAATNILPNSPWLVPPGGSTTRRTVLLAVSVGSQRVGERVIRANAGYLPYTIDFKAGKGQPIKISYWAPATLTEGAFQVKLISPEAWAVIDEVSLVAR